MVIVRPPKFSIQNTGEPLASTVAANGTSDYVFRLHRCDGQHPVARHIELDTNLYTCDTNTQANRKFRSVYTKASADTPSRIHT
jgi:hypothetical protein